MAEKLKKIFFRFFSVLTGILIAFLLLELSLYFIGPKYSGENTTRFYTNYRNYFKNKRKDEDGRIYYYIDYKNDDNGYRIAGKKTEAKNRDVQQVSILFLGDSFTYGVGVEYDDIYTTYLGRLLSAKGYNCFIKNTGICGNDFIPIKDTYYKEVKKKRYDFVVYAFVLNDFGLDGFKNIYGYDLIDKDNNIDTQYSLLRERCRTYNFIINCLQKINLHSTTIKEYKKSFEDKNAKEYFKQISKMHEEMLENGQEFVIMLFPILYSFKKYPFKEMHDRLRKFCERENIAFIDLLPYFESYKDKDLWIHPNDHHPNDLAHKITAEVLYDFFVDGKFLSVR